MKKEKRYLNEVKAKKQGRNWSSKLKVVHNLCITFVLDGRAPTILIRFASRKELSLEIICGMFAQYTKYIFVMCVEKGC